MINKKMILKTSIVILMIIILLYLLVWAGAMRCKTIPGMCSLYWGTQTLITGKQQPSILIVYSPSDTDGLGNPYLLEKNIRDNKSIGMNVRLENINYLSEEKLKNEAMVIVTRSRKISTPKIEMFIDYVSTGGRLVWIGDAGIEAETNQDILATKGDLEGSYDSNIISGWARIDSENYIIRFDNFLGVTYLTNYCQIKDCDEKTYDVSSGIEITYKKPKTNNGVLIPSSDHRMVYGLRSYLGIKDDFAIVQTLKPMTTPLKLDYGSKLFSDEKIAYGNSDGVFPLIVLSNSNKVAYYALPPEYLIEEDDKDKYISILENMMYGMLK
jgi:hypothetical protein